MELGTFGIGKNITLVKETPLSTQTRTAKVGFSYTVIFFGALVSLFRGDWKTFFLHLLIDLALGIMDPTQSVRLIVELFIAFFINKLYIRHLLEKGYRGVNAQSTQALMVYAGVDHLDNP